MLARWAGVAAISAGAGGGIAGLIVGLFVNPPTAPVAAVELGFPAIVAGGVVGTLAGLIMTAARRVRRDRAGTP